MIKLTDTMQGAIYIDATRITQVLPPDTPSHLARVLVDAPIGFHIYRVSETPERVMALVKRAKGDCA